MKKLLAYIVLLIYFCVSTGFVVSKHYCMNKFDSVRVGAASEMCGKCGMYTQDSGGCCRDEVNVIKLQIDKQVAKMFVFSFALLPYVLPLSQHLHLPFFNFRQAHVEGPDSPPPLRTPPIYLSIRVLLI